MRECKDRAVRKADSVVLIILAVILLVTGVAAGYPRASGTDCRYFHETGHYACGEFLSFFNTWGGLEVFGYPLSEAFHDPAHGGLYVQYFQRARMEWHGANPDPYKVEVGLLADELGYSFPPARPEQIPPSNGSLHRYFPETRHVASYAFLDYFREHGGLRIFGYPRSEFMYEGGHVVQYFQRMRMEWHPERAVGSQMLLANLGEVYIERFGVPGNYLDPVQPPSAPGESVTNASGAGDADANPYRTVTRLSASASVREAITGRQGTQTLYVYVTDQQHNPVAGASVTMMARYPSRRQRLELEPTNDSGFTKGSFEIFPTSPGRRVIIDVLVTYHSLERTTQTFFLPWW